MVDQMEQSQLQQLVEQVLIHTSGILDQEQQRLSPVKLQM
jgi:hypothetical protein